MHHQQGALIIGSENAEQVLRRPSRNSTPKKVHLIQSHEQKQETAQPEPQPEPKVDQQIYSQPVAQQDEAAYWAEYRRQFEESMKRQAMD